MPLSLLGIKAGSASFLRINSWSIISSPFGFAGPANAKKHTLKKGFKIEKRDKIQEGLDRFQLSHIGNYLSKTPRGYTYINLSILVGDKTTGRMRNIKNPR